MQVFIQEHKACEVSLLTHCITCFTTSLPFLLLLPCLVAIVLIPLCDLNSSGTRCCSHDVPARLLLLSAYTDRHAHVLQHYAPHGMYGMYHT